MNFKEKQTKTAAILLASTLVVVVLGGIGCLKLQTSAEQTENVDATQILENAKVSGLIMSDAEVAQMIESSKEPHATGEIELPPLEVEELSDAEFTFHGALADVTGGASYGMAHLKFENQLFDLYAEIGNMPELEEGQFFEAWIVDRGENQRVISLGEFTQDERGNYFIAFRGGSMLMDYEFFVVTMEWGDDDTSAGLHILEGEIKR